MGFPLNRFEHLYYFKQNMEKWPEEARKALAQFKCIAIILHDPDDKAFERFLQERFRRLDSFTGQRLLFISFIAPDEEMRSELMSRHYYSFAPKGLESEAYKDAVEGQMAAQTLKYWFGIKEEGSFVILTDNMFETVRYVFPTSETDLLNQLDVLTEFAESDDDWEVLQQRIRGLRERRDKDILESLLKFFALTSPTGMSFSSEQQRYILEAQQDLQERLPVDLSQCTMDSDEDEWA